MLAYVGDKIRVRGDHRDWTMSLDNRILTVVQCEPEWVEAEDSTGRPWCISYENIKEVVKHAD